MMNQIRNIAVSGVDTLEKANKVCEIVEDDDNARGSSTDQISREWYFDDGYNNSSMFWWYEQEAHHNFQNCTQMTYEEFLEKYDNKDDSELTYSEHQDAKREMEKDSEPEKEQNMSETEQIKKEYEKNPDRWVVYFNFFSSGWGKCHDFLELEKEWIEEQGVERFKLILKEHEHIADAVIANPDVEIKCGNGLIAIGKVGGRINNFFDFYNEKYTYQLAKPQCDGKFNGGYIKASQEAYDLLKDKGYEGNIKCLDKIAYISVSNNGLSFHELKSSIFRTFKQFYINNGALSWWDFGDEPAPILCTEDTQINSMEDLNELPIVGEEDGKSNNINNDNNIEQHFRNSNDNEVFVSSISIKDDNGKEYKFEKPSFECELLKVVEDGDGLQIVGYIVDLEQTLPIVWNTKNGYGYTNYFKNDEYCLTPIKPKWFEDESITQAYMIDKNGIICISRTKEQSIAMLENGLRLATSEEILNSSIYYQGKE